MTSRFSKSASSSSSRLPPLEGRASRWALLGIAVFATLWYVALGQRSFYLYDGLQIVYTHLYQGNLSHPRHPLYLPVLWAFSKLWPWASWTLHDVAVLFSGLSTGLAVLLFGLLARRRLVGRRALLAQLLFAICPAVSFFATVVEFHAFFLPLAVLGFLVAERVRPGGSRGGALLSGVLLGLSTWLAAMAHSTGHLLVPLLLIVLVERHGTRALLTQLGSFVMTHGVLLLAGTPMLHRVLGRDGLPGQPVDWLREWFEPLGAMARFSDALLLELFLPFLPISLLLFLPWWKRVPARSIALSVLAVLPYLLLCAFVLIDPLGQPIHERGAYLLPLAIAGALLLARNAPRGALLPFAIGLAFVLSTAQILKHDTRPGRAYAEGFRKVLASGSEEGKPVRALLFCGGAFDLPAVLLEMPEVQPWQLAPLLVMSQADFDEATKGFTLEYRKQLRSGKRLFVSDELFRDPPGSPAVWRRRMERLRAWMRRDFRLLRREEGAFSGYELRGR